MAYVDPSGSVCIRIFNQSLANPHAPALRQGDQTLTYRELEGQVSQFAGFLAQSGVGPGATVGLCMERSTQWIIAALSIMRTGSAYVPLEPTHPEERLEASLLNAGATICIVSSDTCSRVGKALTCIDPVRDTTAIVKARPFSSSPSIDPESLAYVIYTSGSTGTPKGVEITHANLAHLATWHKKAFAISPGDRVSHIAGLGFDAAVWELWPNLAAGATVCLAVDGVRFSPDLLQQWLLEERIDVAFVPTVHAEALTRMSWPTDAVLRTLLTGGDTLQQGPQGPLPFSVVNNYGPTECTVVSTSTVLAPGLNGPPPIGRPIEGTMLYLLDETDKRVEDGQIGTIYIGGRGVGRGYRNLPDETLRCFKRDPFVDAAGARMYCTGDRGVRLPDGNIEFRGRLDRQVKIRGQRIELDEIGSALSQHPAVAFARVNLESGGEHTPQIVAYLLARAGSQLPTVAELQTLLSKTLPKHMLPSAFMRLKTLPLTPSGKLDAEKLAGEVEGPLQASNDHREGRSPLGDKMLDIVRTVLGNTEITAQDDFFLFGGHSLLGMQMIVQITKAFGVSLSIRQLFESPTADALAGLVERKLCEQRVSAFWRELLDVETIGLDQDFFQLGGEERTFEKLLDRLRAEFGVAISEVSFLRYRTVREQAAFLLGVKIEDGSNLPGVVALQQGDGEVPLFWLHYPCLNLAKAMPQGKPYIYVGLCEEELSHLGERPALSEIAKLFVAKLVATQPHGPYELGGFCVGGLLAYEVACQMQQQGLEIASLVMLDTPSPEHYGGPHRSMADWTRRMSRLRKVGVRKGISKLLQRTGRPLLKKGKVEAPPAGEMAIAQRLLEYASARYLPSAFQGDVLLILASDHSPESPTQNNFLPWWQSRVSSALQYRYVRGDHHALIENPVALEVADVIGSYLLRSQRVLVEV